MTRGFKEWKRNRTEYIGCTWTEASSPIFVKLVDNRIVAPKRAFCVSVKGL